MACGTNSKDFIKGLFPDNNTQSISPSDLRDFVDAIYTEAILHTEIIDDVNNPDPCKPISSTAAAGIQNTKEEKLGVPAQTGFVLTSTASGVRSWKSVASDLVSLSDTSVLNPGNGDHLVYDGAQNRWVNKFIAVIEERGGLEYKTGTTYKKGDIVSLNSNIYVAVSPAPTTPGTDNTWKSIGAPSLTELSDVELTAAADKDVLVYNGTKWVNEPASTLEVLEQGGTQWNQTSNYSQGDVVSNSGSLYIAKTNNLNSIPTSTSNDWFDVNSLELGGRAFSAGVLYSKGDIVSYKGTLFTAKSGQQGNTPAVTSLFWEASSDSELGGRAWILGKAYSAGDVATLRVNADQVIYVCLSATDAEEPGTGTAWQALNLSANGGKGYDNNLTYQRGDIVSVGYDIFIAKQNTLKGEDPGHPGSAHAWQAITYNPRGGVLWVSSVNYRPGDIVSQNGEIYVALTTHTATNPSAQVPAGIKPDWKIFRAQENGGVSYDDTKTYTRGDIVSVGSETFIALGDNLKGDDPAAVNQTGNWYNASTPEKGGIAWHALDSYTAGTIVSFSNDFYSCTTAVQKALGTAANQNPDISTSWKLLNIRDSSAISFSTTIEYKQGDIVYYQGQLWISQGGPGGSYMGPWDVSKFELVTPYEKAGRLFSASLTYKKGDIITMMPFSTGEVQIQSFIALTDIATNQAQPNVSPEWKEIDISFNVNMKFNPSKDYKEFDTVYGHKNGAQHLFMAPSAGVQAGAWDASKWIQQTFPEKAGLSWSTFYDYKTGDTVTVGKRVYVALTDNTNKNPGLEINANLWACTNRGGQVYDNTFEYYPGDVVSANRKVYIALTQNTNKEPKITGPDLNWLDTSINEVGGVLWTATFDYAQGDVVSFFDTVDSEWRLYTCLADDIGASDEPKADGSNPIWRPMDTIERGGRLFDVAKAYKQGDIVSVNENGNYVTYISLSNQKGIVPTANPTEWFRSSVVPGTVDNQILTWNNTDKKYVPTFIHKEDVDMDGITKIIDIPGKQIQSLNVFVNGSLQRKNDIRTYQYSLAVTSTGSKITFNSIPQAGDWVHIDAVAL